MSSRGRRVASDEDAARSDDASEEDAEDEEEAAVAAPDLLGKAPASAGGDDGSSSSEDEEDEEALFDETHTVEEMLARMEHAGGPKPYEVLAARKRAAAEKSFRAEMSRRGIDASAADLSSGYGASELLDMHALDKEEMLAKNPQFALFLGAARKGSGSSAPKGSLGRGRSKKPRLTRKRAYQGEADKKLAEANMLYTRGEPGFSEAIALLHDVVRLTGGNAPDPYLTLASINEELGRAKNAFEYRLIAAHLTPRQLEPWMQCAAMSRELGEPRQALYCLAEAQKIAADDLEIRWAQAELYAEIGEPRRALEQLSRVFAEEPRSAQVAERLARTHETLGDAPAAASLLDDFLARDPARGATSSLVELALRLKTPPDADDDALRRALAFVAKHARFVRANERADRDAATVGDAERAARDAALSRGLSDDAADAAARAAAEAARATVAGLGPADVSLALATRWGATLARLGRVAEAREAHFERLRAECASRGFDRETAPLLAQAAEACVASGTLAGFAEAEALLSTLCAAEAAAKLPKPAFDVPETWATMATCARRRAEAEARTDDNRVERLGLGPDGVGDANDVPSYSERGDLATIAFYRSVLARHPRSFDAKAALAEALLRVGRDREVLASMPAADELAGLSARDALRALALRRAAGSDDDFLAVALPLVRFSAARAASTGASTGASGAAAGPPGAPVGGSDVDPSGLFQGYRARDRRRPEKRRRDEEDAARASAAERARRAAEAAVAETAANVSAAAAARRDRDRSPGDGDDDAGTGTARSEAPAASSAPAAASFPAASAPAASASALVSESGAFGLILMVAHAAYRRGNFAECLATVDATLERCKLSLHRQSALRHLRACACEATGDARGATESAKATCAAHPRSAEAWHALHRNAVAAGEVNRLVRFVERAVDAEMMSDDREKEANERAEKAAGGEEEETEEEETEEARKRRIGAAPLLTATAAFRASGKPSDWTGAFADLLRAASFAPGEAAPALLAASAASRLAAFRASARGSSDASRRNWAALGAALANKFAAIRGEQGNAREGWYALAKTAHRLGVPRVAAAMYERCLSERPSEAGGESADPRMEAAHNLALIYRAAGEDHLARRVLREHAVV